MASDRRKVVGGRQHDHIFNHISVNYPKERKTEKERESEGKSYTILQQRLPGCIAQPQGGRVHQ